MLELYRRLLTPGAEPYRDGDEAALHLWLAGLVAVRRAGQESEVRVRNRIGSTVFNATWVETEAAMLGSEPDA